MTDTIPGLLTYSAPIYLKAQMASGSDPDNVDKRNRVIKVSALYGTWLNYNSGSNIGTDDGLMNVTGVVVENTDTIQMLKSPVVYNTFIDWNDGFNVLGLQ